MEKDLIYSQRTFSWNSKEFINFTIFVACVYIFFTMVSTNVLKNNEIPFFSTLGIIGIWRYGWWFTHFLRAKIFKYVVFKKKRERANVLWRNGWRPENLYFMMTTYKEQRLITEKVLCAIFNEIRDVGLPAKIFIGSGDLSDERTITTYAERQAKDLDIQIIIIRQNRPGKRFAIGLVLRAMSRHGVSGDDPVVFLDGDSILSPGCLQKCLPFFEMDKALQALTTDEMVKVDKGPGWVRAWLTMRFAQRNLAMQSHALSNRVLTLTGRMSVFRAKNIIQESFIRTVESDHLHHWLWHDFRFLSGDDKSTWYWLLKAGGNMLYVPDALVVTVETIEGRGTERMLQNLLRWSGNVLRNGSRALALGPRPMGLFIWWCILDQRLAMWTTLIGPIGAIIAALCIDPVFLFVYAAWVMVTRTFLSILLFPYAGAIYLSFPFFLFANQITNALVKVYLVFRLPKQRWLNRGNQRGNVNDSGSIVIFRRYMARYLTTLWVSVLIFILAIYLGIFKPLPLNVFLSAVQFSV